MHRKFGASIFGGALGTVLGLLIPGVGPLAGLAIGTTLGGARDQAAASRQGVRAAKRESREQEAVLARGMAEVKAGEEMREGEWAAEQARLRQRALRAGRAASSETLLTGPLGLTGDAGGARKTLLGA